MFRVLGPVEVLREKERVDLGRAGTPKARCLLAVLLRAPGVLVSTAALVERVWGDEPRTAEVRYKYVSWLRAALKPHGIHILYQDDGYLIDAEPEDVDLHRFRRYVRAARTHVRSSQTEDAIRAFDAALNLWRGDALAGIPGAWAADFRAQLSRERLDATLERLRLELPHGITPELIRALTDLASDHPADERAAALLMTAFHERGATADALAVYQSTRERIRASLGVEPGPELRRLNDQILSDRDRPSMRDDLPPKQEHLLQPESAPFEGSADGETDLDAAWMTPPRQLPPAVRYFTGRDEELKQLTQLTRQSRVPGVPVFCEITGTAGVGKTTLAVYWAHQVAHLYPDGQLYVNLNGFGPRGDPLDPQEVIASLLDALAVPRSRIPQDPQARTGLYRSLLASRTMLIILDNARDLEQIRWLLPASSSCLVIVTSRIRLTALATNEGASLLSLASFRAEEAIDMLQQRFPAATSPQETAAMQQLAAHCSGLPLALALVASRLSVTAMHQPSALLEQLRRTRSRLDLTTNDDSAADLRAVFSWSYQRLNAEAAQMFRTVGLHPSTEMSLTSLIAMAGRDEGQTTAALERLLAANMLEEISPQRYRVHDLLRAYAIELAATEDTTDERRARMRRAFDHYLQTAYRASALVDSQRDQIGMSAPEGGINGDHLASRQDAMNWFAVEHPSLTAAITQSAAEGFEGHSWRLARSVSVYLSIRGHWEHRIVVQSVALEAARRISDQEGEAHALREIGLGNDRLGRYEEALHYLTTALETFTALSDVVGRARTCNDLAAVHDRLNRPGEALEMDQQALDLFRVAGHRAGEATSLNSVGWDHARLGDYATAIEYCTSALTIMSELGDRNGEAATWDSIGFAQRHLGRHGEAIASFERALNLARSLADRPLEGEILLHLGETQLAASALPEATENLRRSLVIMNELKDPASAAVRSLLTNAETSNRSEGGGDLARPG